MLRGRSVCHGPLRTLARKDRLSEGETMSFRTPGPLADAPGDVAEFVGRTLDRG